MSVLFGNIIANKNLITKDINAFDWEKRLSERCVSD